MSPELAEKPTLPEPEIDTGVVRSLLTSMMLQLAQKEEAALEREILKVQNGNVKQNGQTPENTELPPCWVEFLKKYGRLAGQILRVQTRISKNFIQILPQMGRHCRDMLSDQGFHIKISLVFDFSCYIHNL